MKVLIVYAHQETQSFNAALLTRSVEVLTAHGHEVRVSDLYAMGFNPVATADDFHERRFPDRLQYDREQKHNYQGDSLSDDIAGEIEKLLWCDLLILQFPLWWFSVPAIMKGWIDRVFVNGAIYGSGRRYDTGGLNGRRAMVVTSTAAYPGMCAARWPGRRARRHPVADPERRAGLCRLQGTAALRVLFGQFCR
jgi:NAD(P)H dehydrogenase (quinone)